MIVAATLVSALSLLLSPTAATTPATLVAAGDIASCSSTGDEATAALVARIPGTVATLGDTVYDRGSADEFARCYSWRRFAGRTRAALGNHDYGTGNADAAIALFRLPARGWYSYRLGAWHVIVLNSNCSHAGGCEAGSPQERWLRSDLASHRSRCTLAYWHHPRWSSGMHGSDRTMAALWNDLARGGADVVLSGHDHHYERFAPIGGIRSFVVGTGGRSHYPVLRRLRTSRAVNDRDWGVLRLTLRAAGYSWRFVPVAGATWTDTGTASCR
jgi:hypothetical protein